MLRRDLLELPAADTGCRMMSMALEAILIKKSADIVAKRLDPLFDKVVSAVAHERGRVKAKSLEAFRAYYETTIRKYATTKTILYRSKPVKLYDFYIELDLATGNEQLITTANVDFF
jgi:hypothetical protein